jgi:hypothetical protein
MGVRVVVEVGNIENVFAGLDKRTIAKGTARGLNKMAEQARTAQKNRLRSLYTIKARAISKAVKLLRAKPSKLVATLRASGRNIRLTEYSANQNIKGVSVKIKRGGGRKKFIGHFKAELQVGVGEDRKGVMGVFRRPDPPVRPRREFHLPIIHVKGPSVPQLYGSKAAMRDLSKFVGRKLDPLIGHEVMFEVNKKRLRPKGRGV